MRRVEANGTTIAYAQSGQGAPLLLLHGAEADHAMFDDFAPLLAQSFTVIAYDQRDCGDTRNPAQLYGLEELAGDAAALVAALGYARAHVFGTSLGGAIAQVLAARHPERVDRLVLASTFRAGTPPLAINPEVFPKLAALRGGLPQTASEIARYFFPDELLAGRPELLDMFKGNRRDEAQKERRAGILTHPVTADLGAIKAPTLVLVGAEDRLIPPAHSLSLASEIAGAQSVVLPALGHVGTIQDPDAVARAVLSFLREETKSTVIPSAARNP
ncbi:MAG: alpha/beta fold hydrolase [Alphaproteobacteria bacterium]|nr:alpha/beta fold hydrolase [Alphaproteobacteria bacterium]